MKYVLVAYCRASGFIVRETIHLPSNPVRVIAGTYRSRQLAAPRGLATRPTSDRLRETLFNILTNRIDQAVFADLYAGSGAVGIEALSRGAQLVRFVEKASTAVAVIRKNLTALSIHSGYELNAVSVSSALAHFSPASIVFLDPPYDAAGEYERTLCELGRRADSLLTTDGIVIAEHSRKTPLEKQYGSLGRYRVVEQGDAALSFYTK